MDLQQKQRIWDVPTRLFHWLLVFAVAGMWYTGSEGIMEIHFKLGYTILGLLLFRFAWGFLGGTFSRFNAFLLSPKTSITYLKNGMHTNYPGHNPLGSWGVVLLLLSLSIQVTTGLFSNDSILDEGPLAQFISVGTSDWLTSIHEMNFNLLLGLITAHVAAVIFHAVVRKEDLVSAMITGRRKVDGANPQASYGSWKAFAAIVIIVVACVIGLTNLS